MSLLKKILLYGFITSVLLFLGFNLYLFKLGGVERIVNGELTKLVESKHDLKITVGDLGGNMFDGITITDINVFNDDSTSFYQLLHIPSLQASYSIRNLWNAQYILSFLKIDSAQILLQKDSTGSIVLPSFLQTDSTTKRTMPTFAVDELVIENLNLKIAGPEDTTGLENLYLSVALQGTGNTIGVNIDRFEFVTSDMKYQLDAAGGKLTYADKRLLFQDIYLVSSSTRIKLDGNVSLTSPPSGEIAFSIDNADLQNITKFFPKTLKGNVDLDGQAKFNGLEFDGNFALAGQLYMFEFDNLIADFHYSDKILTLDTVYGAIMGGCNIDGQGELDFSAKPPQYWFSSGVSHFDLDALIHKGLKSDLTGSFEINGQGFKKEEMLLDIEVELYESSFDEYPIQEGGGRILVTTKEVRFPDTFRVSYFENEFAVTGLIDYANDMRLEIVADLPNLSRYQGKLFIDQPAGRATVSAVMEGKTTDPDLRGELISDSLWIYDLSCGSLKATADINSFFRSKHGSIAVEFSDGMAWSLPYDSGTALLAIDSNLISINSASIGNEYWQMNGHGLFDYGPTPMKLTLDTVLLTVFDQSFENKDDIAINIDSAGFNLEKASLRSGSTHLDAFGRINYDESMDLSLYLDQIDATPWISLFDDSLEVSGVVSCDARVSGTFLSPTMKLSGTVQDFVYRGLDLGDLHTSVYYRNQLLQIDSAVVYSQVIAVNGTDDDYSKIGRYHARGFIPINLAFTTLEIDRIPNDQLDLTFTMRDNKFDLVSLMLPSVELLEGDFFSRFRLSGTPQDPRLEGMAELKNGRMKYFDLEHPIFVDSAGIRMENNKIIIDEIEAYSTTNKERNGKKRYANIEGELIVKSLDTLYYDVDLTFPKEFPYAYELDDIKGVVEGELHVEGDTPPKVTGDLTMLSTRYLVAFAEPDEGSPIMMALAGENTWDLDINVDILSNYWIKNEDIDAAFSGDMRMVREGGQYRFFGQMEVVRGKGYLFDKTFRIDPGGTAIFDGSQSFNPILNMVAYTRIHTNTPDDFEENRSSEMIDVGVIITGTLDTVDINPVEGSMFSREELLPLLVANYYSSETISTGGAQIQQRLSSVISNQMSQIGTRRLNQLGVETFEIEPVYGDNGERLSARITLGSYIFSSNFYIYGRSLISGRSGQEAGFEWRWSRAFLVEGQRDEDELYHLNLKMHLEF